MSRTLSILLMAMMIFPGMAQYGGDTEAFAADDTYTVSYSYMGDYPEAVMSTLPSDPAIYTDGDIVTAIQPSQTEVTVDGVTYKFEGWSKDEVEVNGKDIEFIGTWEDSTDEGDGDNDENEDEMEPDDDIPDNPQPSDPAAAVWATVTSTKSNASTGRARLFHFSNGDYGTGLCAYHNRKPSKGAASGWLREITPDQPNYEQIKRLMYWGVYKREGNLDNATTYSVHIYLSYLRNGAGSLGQQRDKLDKHASKCAKFISKPVPETEGFKIFEWITSGKKQIAITYSVVKTGYVQILKKSAETDVNFLTEAPNNYTLEGAVYGLYTDPACTQPALTPEANPAKLTTNADGSTNKLEIAAGSYYVKEDSASKGFTFDTPLTTRIGRIDVTTAHTKAAPFVVNSVEEPTYNDPNFKIYKYDPTGVKGWDRLINAEYTISYYDITVPYGDEDANQDPAAVDYPESPTRSWTFKTRKMESDRPAHIMAGFDWAQDTPVEGSDEFYMEDGKRVLPVGYYTIKETKSPVGAALSEEVNYGKVYQKTNGADATNFVNGKDASSDDISILIDVADEPQAVEMKINKVDAETGEATAQGSDREFSKGSLEGAEYEVWFDNDEMAKPELIGLITTDENGVGTLKKKNRGREEGLDRNLEVGNYTIKEVKASPGYVVDSLYLDGEETKEVEDYDIEVAVTYTVGDNTENEVVRGRFENGEYKFRARSLDDDASVFLHALQSKETAHHTVFHKTDITTGGELPGATLQVINSDGELVEEWVSTTEPHDIVALPDGTYTLREITAPYGYDVAEDVEFEVKANEIMSQVEMKNKPVTVETTATDTETDTHQGVIGENVTVKDVVKMTGLYEGRGYKVSGRMIDKATGETLKDKDGNDATAETEFTATGDTMEVELTFTIDSSEFTKDTSAVAFEKLYRTTKVHEVDADVVPIELQKHEDPEDDDQTIHYGGVAGTVATDDKQIGHNVLGTKDCVVVDTVEYKNLSTKETYTLEGELFDKTTGATTGVKVTKEFTPEKPDGKVQVVFKFDASNLKHHELVAFESLFLKGKLIDEHKDPNDPKQTVNVPEIGTYLADDANKKTIKDDVTTLIDTVAYKGLTPGNKYAVVGELIVKETGNPLVESGKKIKAVGTFTAEAANGSTEVEFTVKTKGLNGKHLVAFETAYNITGIDLPDNPKPDDVENKGAKIAEHKDIKDPAQTVLIKNPKKGTPDTGDNLPLGMALAFITSLSGLGVLIRRRALQR